MYGIDCLRPSLYLAPFIAQSVVPKTASPAPYEKVRLNSTSLHFAGNIHGERKANGSYWALRSSRTSLTAG